ncbi:MULTISPECIES: 3'-5' exonuclease [Rhizobium]|uniref:3'-5' exonuclease n=1 Tax=Rhizobium TaxID=379 RepID=UPI001039D981|nr:MULTISPECIES: 3'-5' exonuclease [Rhizobium]NEH37247.1 3'-5' exonuclease [Rhizobium ruizarguesonis]NEJ32665.1 3'-5' exonuclease [Rhizobium ruizarguesonis]TBY89583.1 3'-5' exonuclease [Rhizobium leguminosarum bv. viciae]TCA69910.1 3'-5' exonuclease [Rhizobium leguminosarum bv. viciae]TCB46622.1 3'-5' exonuclease [Rhizobium leguminosarum bv. viciae]
MTKLPNKIQEDAAPDQAALERMAEMLSASGNYRVQRRLSRRDHVNPPEGTPTRRALFVDVETTGLDATTDEIIEIAMVPFEYGVDGRIFGIGQAYQTFNEPTTPIPAAATRLTGITDEMVAGHKIDLQLVDEMVGGSSLIVAHNSNFDRRFAENLSRVFEEAAWACSMTQIDWAAEGHEGTKLVYLAASNGFFYDGHRAEHDCYAAIELLAQKLPVSGKLAMAAMLEKARKPSWRVWAENSPYDLKDQLKRRGYRWNGDANGRPRAWYIDVEDELHLDEINFLRKEIYLQEVELFVQKITAYNRFSNRQ